MSQFESEPVVAVALTGVANLASVCAALRRAKVRPICTSDPEVFASAALAVLPGVGSFASGMQAVRSACLDSAITERVARGRPLLAICLGMQMLCESSEESPGVSGLGVIPVRVTAFQSSGAARVPQLGWNTVTAAERCALLRTGSAYFANSYCVPRFPSGWIGASSVHSVSFVAAMERGALLACQFHPELSGRWGGQLIERWVRSSLVQRSIAC